MHLSQQDLRETFEYAPSTGRLVRRRRGRGARIGVEIGGIDNGHRRAYYAGRNRMTAHMVWVYHHGSEPRGILRHKNGDTSDDRIENLEALKQPLRVEYFHEGAQVSEYGRLPERQISGIYEIFCTANGRRYVGSAADMDKRWREHFTQLNARTHHSRHLQRAWGKHGSDAFLFRVLEKCPREALIAREQHHIDALRPEFNSRPVAHSNLGWAPSDETREKMRAAHVGKPSPKKGKPLSAETRARISASKTGVRHGSYSAERIAKAAAAFREAKGAATDDQVREVRRLKAGGLKLMDIASATGLRHCVVADISRGKTFKWVD